MTFDEAIQILPPPIADRLRRHRVYGGDDYDYPSLHNVVAASFEWAGTPQRWDFWSNVCWAARGEREYPSVKGVPE